MEAAGYGLHLKLCGHPWKCSWKAYGPCQIHYRSKKGGLNLALGKPAFVNGAKT